MGATFTAGSTMSMRDVRHLETGRRAIALQREAFAVARRFPPEATFELGSQVRRSANAIVTDIVEGHGPTTWATLRTNPSSPGGRLSSATVRCSRSRTPA
jgi:hypothetical protein